MANAARERTPEAVGLALPAGSLRLPAGAWHTTDVHAALGVLEPGAVVVALSKGLISMTDAIRAALATTGAARLTLTTWTVAADEIGALARLLEDGRITGLQLVTDDSLRRRHGGYVALWRARFGAASIRLARCHMKSAVLVGAERSVTILSSANMNAARRAEAFTWVEGRALADLITGALAYWFDGPENVDATTATIARQFERWGADGAEDGPGRPAAPDRPAARVEGRAPAIVARGALQAATGEDAAYFTDDPFGVDLRRAGASYL